VWPGRSDAGRDDADGLATARLAELHVSLDQREERVISPAADIRTGMELGAALPDQNLTGVDGLAAETLDASRCAVESRPLRELEAPFL
jgi:hypothetical protein